MKNKYNPSDKVIFVSSLQAMIIEQVIDYPIFMGLYICSWIDAVAGEKITMAFKEKSLVRDPSFYA